MQEIYLLNDAKFEGVKNIGVFRIEYLKPKFTPKNYDAIIFTSKNAVLAIDKIYKEWVKLPAYSIGEGTSRVIKEFGGRVIYEARSSYGDDFAGEIVRFLEGKSVLFARAKVVASNLSNILKQNGVLIDELIVYETLCKPCDEFEAPKNGIFIFTSPSSVKCFLKCVRWQSSFTAVAIGKKTAAAFPPDIKPVISPKANVGECVALAKRLSKDCI
ncbi:MAG: uroporphyrinogen-III synthase [Campylobacteraceae bacterium]|jgi:uroporphyrinogen-III synthase|nr:uroporphyrinogen-III synthase [Campylobacteraceae bacterium]